MATIYDQARKHRYRVTLELDVLGDFDPHNINWEKMFKLDHGERCDAYIEDLDSDIW
jgi:hypothetical protein